MANITSIGGNPIVPAAVQNDTITDAMLKQTGGVLSNKMDKPQYVSNGRSYFDSALSEIYISGGDGTEKIGNLQIFEGYTRISIMRGSSIVCWYSNETEKKTGLIEVPAFQSSGVNAIVVIKSDANINQTGLGISLQTPAYNYAYSTTIEQYMLDQLESRVEALEPGEETKYTYATGVSADVLAGLYVLENGWTVTRVYATDSLYRFGMKDENGNTYIQGNTVAPIYYSDKIQRFYNPDTGETVAYYVLHYTGSSYTVDGSYSLTSHATTLSDSKQIDAYLSREQNLVLIGDSIFGYSENNVLEALLAEVSGKQVFNGAFGGCRMSWSNASGNGTYDPFSFVSVSDAVSSGDYTALKAAATSGVNASYPCFCAALTSVDWTKPTTIFVNYCNNDLTAAVPIGDQWEYTDEQTDFDKTTLLGAFNYGIGKIVAAYPHVRVVEFTPVWRAINGIPPYAYENSGGVTPAQYASAITENAHRQGFSVFDFLGNSGRNWYNTSYYQADASHYNEKGYAKLATLLNEVDNSFLQ